MKSINQIQAEHDTKNIISAFIHLIGLGRLSKRINFKRHSTIPLTAVITWLFEAIFSRRSLYRAQPSRWFSSRTARNILNDGRINWQKLLCLVAIKMILILTPFIDQRRRLALIVDDTLIERAYSTKTELLAKIYDHDQHRYSTGYRNLTIGWSDGNTFLPVNCALMSTRKKTNLVGSKSSITDQRTIAGQRRSQAQRKMNEVVLELISQALRLGVTAKYVLFDSWYSSPQMFWHLKELGWKVSLFLSAVRKFTIDIVVVIIVSKLFISDYLILNVPLVKATYIAVSLKPTFKARSFQSKLFSSLKRGLETSI